MCNMVVGEREKRVEEGYDSEEEFEQGLNEELERIPYERSESEESEESESSDDEIVRERNRV
jgi:hypothetical protein